MVLALVPPTMSCIFEEKQNVWLTKRKIYDLSRLRMPRMKGGSNSDTLKAQANTMGESLFKKWNEVRSADIKTIKDMFDENGIIKNDGEHADLLHSASFFSDLYKWTMTPVIRALEEKHGKQERGGGLELPQK